MNILRRILEFNHITPIPLILLWPVLPLIAEHLHVFVEQNVLVAVENRCCCLTT